MKKEKPNTKQVGYDPEGYVTDPLTIDGSDSSIFHHPMVLNIPRVNVSEDEDEIKIELAAPGLNRQDISVATEDNTMIISSSKDNRAFVSAMHEKGDYRQEYDYSSFRRTFILPSRADLENVKAHYHDGVLCVKVPKKAIPEKRIRSIGVDE